MAKRKRKSSGGSMAGRCKIVAVQGKRRKLCWGTNGKLKSNTKA